MLVLYRRIGESIVFGQEHADSAMIPEITVKVLSNDSVNVRLGIEAPSDVTILRHELLERDAKHDAALKSCEVRSCHV